MSGLRPADEEGLAFARRVGSELGFEVCRVYDRDGEGWLIHGFWRGAPVAISLRSGLAGGLGVAFWSGLAGGSEGGWDEVVDTSFAGLDATVALGVAALERYAFGRESSYAGLPLPPTMDPLPGPGSSGSA